MINYFILTVSTLAFAADVTLPELDYNFDAMEPFIDTETMTLHFTKHFQSYADKYNEAAIELEKSAQKGSSLSTKCVTDVIQNLNEVEDKDLRNKLRNNGGGYLNHVLFFRTLQPRASKEVPEPQGELKKAIEITFNSLSDFQVIFNKAALSVFGSGWAWLVLEKKTATDKGTLEIVTTSNQDNPIMFEQEGVYETVPLLGVDVWEHAYYLKYQNRRSDYLTAWWNVVNWEAVNEHFTQSSSKQLDVGRFFENRIQATSAEGWKKLSKGKTPKTSKKSFKAFVHPEDYFIIS